MKTLKLTDCRHVLDVFDADLATSQFREVKLAETSMERATMQDSRFNDVYFDGSQFENCSFAGVSLRACSCAGMTIDGVRVDELVAAYNGAAAAAAAR